LQDETAADDLNGPLRWIKPATADERLFKEAFDLTLTARGSRYIKPLKGQRILAMFAGDVLLSGGNLAAPVVTPFSLSERNVFSLLSASGIKLKAVPAKGLLQGTYKPAARAKALPIRGVFLQKQNAASGFFIGNPSTGPVESGLFELSEPAPEPE
jgi:hypothetical protein